MGRQIHIHVHAAATTDKHHHTVPVEGKTVKTSEEIEDEMTQDDWEKWNQEHRGQHGAKKVPTHADLAQSAHKAYVAAVASGNAQMAHYYKARYDKHRGLGSSIKKPAAAPASAPAAKEGSSEWHGQRGAHHVEQMRAKGGTHPDWQHHNEARENHTSARRALEESTGASGEKRELATKIAREHAAKAAEAERKIRRTGDELVNSGSSAALGKNIKTEVEAGKPQKQAEAIAFSVQRKAEEKTDDDWEKWNMTHLKAAAKRLQNSVQGSSQEK